MILYEVEKGKAKPFAFSTMQHKVQRIRVKLELPSHFTFDACRHGGMTELEEAELTDGQAARFQRTGRSKVTSATPKRTEKRLLAATRKRHAHRLANEMATDVQNEQRKAFRMKALNKA
jgi:histone acetyltransferase (RNA polymerase elongator complex component)